MFEFNAGTGSVFWYIYHVFWKSLLWVIVGSININLRLTYYWSGDHESQCTVVRLNGFMTDRTDVWFIEWFWTRRNKSAERPRTVTWLDNRSMTNPRDFRIRRFPGIQGLDSFRYLPYLTGMFYRLSDLERWSLWDRKIIYYFYDFEYG